LKQKPAPISRDDPGRGDPPPGGLMLVTRDT